MRAGSANIMNAAKPVFDQELKDESPSLENRIHRLAEDLNDLSPDEIDQETNACEQKLNDLLDRIQTVKFARAFPIVEQLTGGKE
jgi:hypothetical protein